MNYGIIKIWKYELWDYKNMNYGIIKIWIMGLQI